MQRKQRQFDICASHAQEHDRIELAIECKRLKPSFPLLISSVPRSENEAFHQHLYGFQRVHGGSVYVRADSVHARGPESLYQAGLLVGKSTTRVGREANSNTLTASDSDVFDKWAQSLASIAELIERSVRYLSVRRAFLARIAFLPVLVVPDGTLWGAKFSSRGELMGDPTQEDEIPFHVGRRYHLPEGEVSRSLLEKDPDLNGMLHTTCIATMLDAGHATNALPQRARANINCRIFPGTTAEEVRQALTATVHDPQVNVSIPETRNVPSAPPPLDPRVLGPAEKLAMQTWKGVPIVHLMQAGTTDGAFLTPVGIPTYGISGYFIDPDGSGAHGRNERIRVKILYDSRDYLYRLMKIYGSQP